MHNHFRLMCVTVIVSAVFGLALFFTAINNAVAQSSQEQERQQLEADLKVLEAQITNIEGDITKTQAEKDTFNNQIYILRNKIKKLDLQIKQSNILIGDLRSQIQDTSSSIVKTSAEIEDVKEQIAEVLRYVYQENQKSKIEIVLASNTLSDFFTNVASLTSLGARLEELLKNTEELNEYLNSQRNALGSEKEDEENFVKIQILQKENNKGLGTRTDTGRGAQCNMQDNGDLEMTKHTHGKKKKKVK